MKTSRYMLLAAVPGLMLCIVPWDGIPFRFSWQLASIWLGGLAFAFFLTGWWRRLFFLTALGQTAVLPPAYESYICLLTLAVFLAASEGFKNIETGRVLDAVCLAGLLLLVWMAAQRLGLAQACYGSKSAGPFNPVAGGCFLALTLPAFFRRRRWPLGIATALGIIATSSTTAVLAGLAAGVVFTALAVKNRKRLALAALVFAVALGFWFWRGDPLQNSIRCDRWAAWSRAAQVTRGQVWGQGLGAWKSLFPGLAKGDKAIRGVFSQAHNEFVQTRFELGLPGLAVILGFLFHAGFLAVTGRMSILAASGLAVLAVASLGFFVMHIAPTALIGCAWIGLSEKRRLL